MYVHKKINWDLKIGKLGETWILDNPKEFESWKFYYFQLVRL
jgi:hypothetical protein